MSARFTWLSQEPAKCAKSVVLPANYMGTTDAKPLGDFLGPDFGKRVAAGTTVKLLLLAGGAAAVWYLVTR